MIGELSAATLGYIHGNVPGAYKGYKLYKSYQNYRQESNMARSSTRTGSRTPTGRKRGTPAGGSLRSMLGTTPMRGRASYAPSSSGGSSRRKSSMSISTGYGSTRSRGGSNGHTAVGRQARTSERDPSVKVYGKRLKLHGHKSVKVSKALRQKISKVVDSKKVHGYYQDTRLDLLDPGNLGGRQQIDLVPNRTYIPAGYLFNYDRILHAASRLWNGKAGNPYNPSVTDVGNFNPLDSVIEVNKQWWTFRLRNNSTRTAYIRCYKCQPKNSVVINDAFTAWTGGLQQMATDGELLASIPPTSVNTLHTGPTLSNQFRAGFRAQTIECQLEPGQEYTFNVNGPKMVYRGQNFYDQSIYRTVQKQDIQLIWSSNVDLVGSHDSSGALFAWGRVPDSSNNIPAGISNQERVIVESTYHVSMSMPEKVGGVTTAVGTLFQNQNRVRRIVIEDVTPQTFQPIMHRRDEENPVVEVNDN